MRYKNLPTTGFTSFEDDKTFTIEIIPPDNCNSAFSPVSWQWGSNAVPYTADLCTTEVYDSPVYVSTAAVWCGGFNYLFNSPDAAIYSHTEDGTDQFITVYTDDPLYLYDAVTNPNPYVLTVRPDYIYDTDETLTYHDGDTIEITYASPCVNYPIGEETPFITQWDVWLFDIETQYLGDLFTTAGYVYCPLDCVQ